MRTVERPPMWTVPELAHRWRVSCDKVRGWLARGELVGINIAADPLGRRPRWRIRESDVVEFEARRGVARADHRGRRRRQPAEIIQFF